MQSHHGMMQSDYKEEGRMAKMKNPPWRWILCSKITTTTMPKKKGK